MTRIYLTDDGRHVTEGDPDAAFLAYADGDNPPADVLAEVEGKAAPKRGRKPADKQAAVPEDKGSGSGLMVTKLSDKDD